VNAATEPREERTAKWFLDEAGRKALLTLEEEAGLAAKAQEGRRAVAALARMTGLPEEELLAYFRRRAADLPGGSEEDARFREAISALGQEGRRLASLATEGAEAWAALVERNLRLAAHFSGERTGEGLDLEDLLQEGNRGLMAAAERFDPSRGVRFSTYAAHWVRQYQFRATVGARSLRLPHNKHGDLRKLMGTRARLEAELGRPPTEEELARALGEGWTPEKVRFFAELAEPVTSLDAPVGEEKDGIFGDLLPAPGEGPEEAALRAWERERLFRALAQLPERQAQAVALRFGLEDGRERLLKEVGAALGVSAERARQLVEKGLERLRELLGPGGTRGGSANEKEGGDGQEDQGSQKGRARARRKRARRA